MAPTQAGGEPPDRDAVIASARERVAGQQLRAARAERIAASYEVVRAGDPEAVRLLRARMARLHREVQARHLTSAALFELYAKRMAASPSGRHQDFRPAFMSAVAATIGVGSAVATMRGRSPAAVVATTSDAVARAAHDLEVALGEGPAVTAMTEGVPVSATGGSLPRRWPLYGPAVGELGVRAVIAVPLRSPVICLGALCAYSREPVLPVGALAAAGQVAEAVAHTVLLVPGNPASGADPPGLELFAESDFQAVVHQAAGMVSAQCGCGIDEAEDLLRARAFADGQPVEQVARAVLRREASITLSLAESHRADSGRRDAIGLHSHCRSGRKVPVGLAASPRTLAAARTQAAISPREPVMSRSTRPDAVGYGGASDVGVPSVPDGFDQPYPDAAVLAQAITSRLFSAGYDLCFVLGMTDDGPGRTKLEHAVSEVDGAIKDLRHLMLTLWEHAHDPPGDSGDGGREERARSDYKLRLWTKKQLAVTRRWT